MASMAWSAAATYSSTFLYPFLCWFVKAADPPSYPRYFLDAHKYRIPVDFYTYPLWVV